MGVLVKFLNGLVALRNGKSNTVSIAEATANLTAGDALDIIEYVLSRKAGFMGNSFSNSILKNQCLITYESEVARGRRQEFFLTENSVNLVVGSCLLPFVDKYWAAELAKRGRSSEETTPVEGPDRKSSRSEEAIPRDPTPEEERIGLATELFCASNDVELESLQKLLTAEIDKRKKPPVSRFVDLRTHLLPPAAFGGVASSR